MNKALSQRAESGNEDGIIPLLSLPAHPAFSIPFLLRGLISLWLYFVILIAKGVAKAQDWDLKK